MTMMKKTWITAFLITVITIICIAGCGNSNEPKTDEAFIQNLSAGLQARWKIANNDDKTERDNAAQREHLTGLVDKELDKLGSYSDYAFTDSSLADLAQQYFDALQMQKDGIKKYGVADEEYEELFGGGYNIRAKLISMFYDNYGLTVKDEYNDNLEDLIQLGYSLIKEEEQFAEIQDTIGEQVVLTALGGDNYELGYTNSTTYDLDNVQFTLKFYDDTGAEVGNEKKYVTVSGGAQSTTPLLLYDVPEFTTAKMSITYKTESSKKETEFKDITVVDNMKVTLTAKNLPVEVSDISTYYGVKTTVELTDISTEEAYWSNGKCTLTMTVSGTKTYDREGEQSSDSCHFLYKIFDSTGNVVDSSTMYASNIMMGDSFNTDTYVSGLEPGEYSIEFYDHQ